MNQSAISSKQITPHATDVIFITLLRFNKRNILFSFAHLPFNLGFIQLGIYCNNEKVKLHLSLTQ